MKIKKILAIILILAIVLILPNYASADVGGGVDWDTDSWGGSGGGGFDYDYDYDYGGGSSGDFGIPPLFFFSGLGNGDFGFFEIIIFFMIISFIFNVIKNRGSNNTGQRRRPVNNVRNDINKNPQSLEKLKAKDPNFSEGKMISWANNVFIQLQNAWTDKEWREVRAYESDSLFNTHKRQLEDFIEKRQTNVVEEISIISTEFEQYREDNANEYISYILQARYKDYVIDDRTGQVIRGDKDKKYLMTYRMSFMRTLGSKTVESAGVSVTDCPNCGAPVSINESGTCEFCGSEISSGDYGWVLYQLEPISQSLA